MSYLREVYEYSKDLVRRSIPTSICCKHTQKKTTEHFSIQSDIRGVHEDEFNFLAVLVPHTLKFTYSSQRTSRFSKETASRSKIAMGNEVLLTSTSSSCRYDEYSMNYKENCV
jgi:hypothetical protein